MSIATVSRVMNGHGSVTDEVRERVLESVNQCGYVPNIGRRATSMLALVYACPFSMGSPYDSSLIEGMAQATDTVDFDLVILNPKRDKRPDETYTQFFVRKGVRGAIVRSTVEGRDVCDEISAEGFPCMVVGDHFPHDRLTFGYAESLETSKQAVSHLLNLGHHRIAFACNEYEDGDHVDRFRGYCEALAAHGVSLKEELIFKVPARRLDGAQLLRSIMSSAQPATAVFVTDPPVAIALINEATSVGLSIPGDLSVVGFDDRDARNYVYPVMTAVCQDARELGYKAFMELARTATDPSAEPRDCIASTWFEINSTTGPAPHEAIRVMPDGTRMVAKAVATG